MANPLKLIALLAIILAILYQKYSCQDDEIPSNLLDYHTTAPIIKFLCLMNFPGDVYKFILRIQKTIYGEKFNFSQALYSNMRKQMQSGYEGTLTDYMHSGIITTGQIIENLPNDQKAVIYKIFPEHLENEEQQFEKVVFYYHGGGMTFLRPTTDYYGLLQVMAKKMNRMIIAIDYAYAPENPFSEVKSSPFFDSYETTKKILIDNKQLIKHYLLIGDSAGGNLATAVGLKISQEFPKIDLPYPKGIYPIYPGVYNGYYFNMTSDYNFKNPLQNKGKEQIIHMLLAYGLGEPERDLMDAAFNDRYFFLKCLDEDQRNIAIEKYSNYDPYLLEISKSWLNPNLNLLGDILIKARLGNNNKAKKQLKFFLSLLNNSYFVPGSVSDDHLKKLVQNLDYGFFHIYVEHDILLSNTEYFVERMKNLGVSNEKNKFHQINGAIHGVFNICLNDLYKDGMVECGREIEKSIDLWLENEI